MFAGSDVYAKPGTEWSELWCQIRSTVDAGCAVGGNVGLGASRELEFELSEIPDDGLLLHIGVHKSGTSSLQAALRRSRELLRDSDVLYQGPYVKDWGAIKAAWAKKELGQTGFESSIQAFPGRVVVSSEFLCTATEWQAATWVARLGAERPVKVLITVRSIADLLPSTWQQKIRAQKSVFVTPYEEWLSGVVADTQMDSDSFWLRNNYPRILQRWGSVVGEENLIFVVSDKASRERIMRVTERLLNLPDRSLRAVARDRGNRSMSYPLAELLRQIGVKTADWLTVEQQQRARQAILKEWRRSGVDQDPVPIPIPGWAADAMRPIGARFAEILEESAATVVGDISKIAEPTQPISETSGPPEDVSIPMAVAGVVGAITSVPPETNAAIESQSQPNVGERERRLPRFWRSRGTNS